MTTPTTTTPTTTTPLLLLLLYYYYYTTTTTSTTTTTTSATTAATKAPYCYQAFGPLGLVGYLSPGFVIGCYGVSAVAVMQFPDLV